MTHEIKNQFDNHIDGELRKEVVWAIEHDKDSFVFNSILINIESHFVEPKGDKITKIKVNV